MNRDPDFEDDISEFGLSDCPECNGIESGPDCECKGAGFLIYGSGNPDAVDIAFEKVYAQRTATRNSNGIT